MLISIDHFDHVHFVGLSQILIQMMNTSYNMVQDIVNEDLIIYYIENNSFLLNFIIHLSLSTTLVVFYFILFVHTQNAINVCK